MTEQVRLVEKRRSWSLRGPEVERIFLEDKKTKCKDTKSRTSRVYYSEISKKSSEHETQGPIVRRRDRGMQEDMGAGLEGLILTMQRPGSSVSWGHSRGSKTARVPNLSSVLICRMTTGR